MDQRQQEGQRGRNQPAAGNSAGRKKKKEKH
jgi:hypothetical protein